MVICFQGVLFDLDGVLVSTHDAWFRVMNEVANTLDRPLISNECFRETWGQSMEEDVQQFYWGYEVQTVKDLYQDYFLSYLKIINVERYAPSIFSILHMNSVHTAVVTNTSRKLASEILKYALLHPKLLVAADDVARPKPAPDLLLKACQELNLVTEEVCMIGDSIYDYQAAKTAGITFIGFGIEGDYVIEQLDQLLPILSMKKINE